MDKKENKRSLKASPYLQYRSKKSKKSLLFSSPSVSSIKSKPQDTFRKSNTSKYIFFRSNRLYNQSTTVHPEPQQKKTVAKTLSPRTFQQSGFKYIKAQNKIKNQHSQINESAKRQWTLRNSREDEPGYRCRKFVSSIGETKPSQDENFSRSIDVESYEKEIKRLETSVNRFRQLHLNSIKKLKKVEDKMKEEELQYERSKQIYIERINTLHRNIEANKRSLGHLYTYDEMNKNIVPNNMILEISAEDKSRDLEYDLEIYEQYYKSTETSLVSEISLVSRVGAE